MKVLLLSALYPPFMLGGAENSARNLAEWLVTQGVEVAVIRATDAGEAEGVETSATGVRIYRVQTPHLYAPFRFPSASGWKKPIWHLQDHFDPRIGSKVGKILDEFSPDLVNVHLIQGLGYPILRELARRKIPVNYVLPDLGLACIRMSMFKNGTDCTGHCAPCKVSMNYKLGLVRNLDRVGFISPSRANMETLSRYFPVKDYPHTAILNPNAYPVPTVARSESPTLRLLYAGRIHSSKGVDLLLEAVERLSATYDVSLAIAGKGQQEPELRERYGNAPWCTFLGFISQQQLADAMMASDLLCIPSIWAENSPGVVIQALGLGLPVMGSDRGGIPELVHEGVNGRLVHEATTDGWATAIETVLNDPAELARWRANAADTAADFDQPAIGAKILAWMEKIAFGDGGRTDLATPAPSLSATADL